MLEILLLQSPIPDGIWANVKDWGPLHLGFVFLLLLMGFGYLLANKKLPDGLQTIEAEESDRKDSVGIANKTIDYERKRAEAAELRAERAEERLHDSEAELKGFRSSWENPFVLRARADELEAHKEPPCIAASGHILVVDDRPDNRGYLVIQLNKFDYRTTEASSADEALHACVFASTNEPFDLILLDESMPRKSGQEFVRELRQQGDATPIIFLTCHGDNIDMEEMKNLGVIGIWGKPVSPKKLFEELRRIIG